MWVRAVWQEGTRIFEDVFPLVWVDEREKRIRWPRSKEAHHMENHALPSENWLSFTLIKVKVKNGKSVVMFNGKPRPSSIVLHTSHVLDGCQPYFKSEFVSWLSTLDTGTIILNTMQITGLKTTIYITNNIHLYPLRC